MNKNSYIGVFDSGIGGLTVVKSIINSLPGEKIVYFGDTAHVPYGTRSKSQILRYVEDDVKFLSTFDIKAIVIACNTADSIAREHIEELYSDIPVFGVVNPASKMAAESTKNGKIGVIATKATVGSHAYDKAITSYNPRAEVISAACPLLVPLVENGRFEKDDIVIRTVLSEYLEPLIQGGIDTLVLGCTHYPLLGHVIADLYPFLNIISSSDAAAATLEARLTQTELLNEDRDNSDKTNPDRKFFVSDDAEGFENQARVFMGDSLGGAVKQVTID